MKSQTAPAQIAVIGGGPAGLMAAERLTLSGHSVTVYERMPTVGRKLLMAGRGGLNVTHSEARAPFITRYGEAASWLEPSIQSFPPEALRTWCDELGQETFVGSSGRVFPKALKASPLLRAWLRRLEKIGVTFALRHLWQGWDEAGALVFSAGDGTVVKVKADATILALGGASWPRLGSDGGWVKIIQQQGVAVTTLRPSNCGFIAPWSDVFGERFAGHPLKPITLTFAHKYLQGEAMITRQGLEGSAIYALSSLIRNEIETKGEALLSFDLRPGLSADDLITKLETPRGSQSTANYLRKFAGLSPAAIGLMRESLQGSALPLDPRPLTSLIKKTQIKLTAVSPIARAISSAGGVKLTEVDADFMLRKKPGIFIIGEMLDWEAPTGGYLLQACFSMAVAAAKGATNYLAQ